MSKVEMTNWNSWQEFKEANVGRSYFVTNKSPLVISQVLNTTSFWVSGDR